MRRSENERSKKRQGNSYASWRLTCVAALLLAIDFATSSLHAVPITVPTDLNVGEKYRLAFVTSTTRNATSASIGDYNTFVLGVANGVTELAALGTTWKAIGSTTADDARDNTGTNPNISMGVPIYRLDDTRIADDNADLWDAVLLAPIAINESGNSLVTSVWAGTNSDGTGFPSIELGTTSGQVGFGLSGSTTSSWANASGTAAQKDPLLLRPLYALSGELTVVPEPSTFASGLMGLLMLSCHGRRRR